MDKYDGEDLEELFPPKWQLFSSSFFPNKPLEKLIEIKKMIKTLDPDMLFLTEVGGAESLENFNKYFLDDQFYILCEPSNSDRGIDLGYMINKRLPYKAELISHTKKRLSNSKKFARGLMELRLSLNDSYVYINYLVHLKSKLNLKRDDFEGRSQRQAEVDYLKELYLKHSKKYDNIPITISGDFNGIIYKEETEQEFKELLEQTDLKDAFEHKSLDLQKRMSYCYFNRQGARYPMQLDYFLLGQKHAQILNSARLIGFNEPYLDTYELPGSLQEKFKMASDHFPLLIELNL